MYVLSLYINLSFTKGIYIRPEKVVLHLRRKHHTYMCIEFWSILETKIKNFFAQIQQAYKNKQINKYIYMDKIIKL